jgi:alkanesulfonate monooxygenase SsuD/methylene tetrahydromethanopterin reductase-like flavin-dependent oxidoreductase (luciferase family)
MDEAIRLIRGVRSGESISFTGRFNTFQTGQFLPTGPVPVLVGGTSRAARRRAALLGDGYMPYLTAPEFLSRARGEIEALATDAGRDLAAFRYLVHLYICPRKTRAESLAEATERMADRYGDEVRGRVERYAIVGTPEQCAESVLRFAAVGADEVVLGPVCDPAALPAELERLAELLPTSRAR